MANIKQVQLDAEVPFHWLDHEGSPEDIAFVAGLLLGPSMGFRYAYHHAGYRPNEIGGKTATYTLSVYGEEAISYPAWDRLLECIRNLGGTVLRESCIDIEAGVG